MKCVTDRTASVAAILIADPLLNIDNYGQFLLSFSLKGIESILNVQ